MSSKYARLMLAKNPLGYWRQNEKRTLDYINAVLLKTPAAHYRLAEVPAITTYAASVLARTPAGYWRLGESGGTPYYLRQLSKAPAGYWRFGDASGTVATDSSGNSRPGTYSGGALGATGALGDGNTAFTAGTVSVPHNAAFAITGDLTLVIWVKPTSFANYRGLISKTSAGTLPAPYDSYLITGTGVPRFGAGDGSVYAFVDANTAPTLNVWSQIVIVKSGTDVTHYLNGQPNGSGSIGAVAVADGGTAVGIGQRNGGGTPFAGDLDEAAIIARALTASEVLALYNTAPNAGTYPTAVDSSGNGRNGAYNGDVALGQTGALTGDANTAVLTDGTTGYVSVGDAGVAAATRLTIETWVYPTASTAGTVVAATQGGNFLFLAYNPTGAGGAGAKTFGVRTAANGGGGTTTIQTLNTYAQNAWYHVVFVYTGSGRAIYINGALENSDTDTTHWGTIGTDWRIGTLPSGANWFTGKLDEVAVYAAALTASEINEHYQVGLGNFSQYNGVTAVDASGNNRNGVYRGAGATAASTLTGDTNTAYNTQGVGYVELPNNAALHPGDVFTVVARIERTSVGSTQTIFDAGPGDYKLYLDSGNYLCGAISGGATLVSSVDPLPSTTTPYEVAWVHQPGSDALYVGGLEETGVTAPATITAASSVISVGAASAGATPFVGTIDEVSVYDVAVAAADLYLRASVGAGNFNQLSGLAAADSSGNNQNGVYSGVVNGNQPGALVYDSDTSVLIGDLGKATLPDGSVPITTGTLIAWVKPHSTAPVSGGLIERFQNSLKGVRLRMFMDKVQAVLGNGSIQATALSATISRDSWHMAAMTWGAGVLKLYVDGVVVVTTAYSLTPSTPAAGNARMGMDADVVPLTGWLDEVSSLGYVLTDAEINELFLAAYQQESTGGVSAACFSVNESLVYFRPDGQRVILHSPPAKAVLSQEGFGMPPLQYVADQAPFQHGDTVRSFTLQPRPLQLTIIQNFTSRATYRDGRASLLDAIRPNRVTDFNTPGSLRYYLANGTKRQLDVLVESGPGFAPPEGGWREWSFTEVLRFVAHDPVWYDPTVHEISFTTSTGNFVFPATFPITFGGFGGQAWVGYLGNWIEYPTFTVTGPLTGLVIQNLTTGDKLELGYTLPAGFAATISLRGVKTITRNDGVNLLNYLTSDSDLATFSIAPDPQAPSGLNLLRVSGSGASSATLVKLRYYDRFIGI